MRGHLGAGGERALAAGFVARRPLPIFLISAWRKTRMDEAVRPPPRGPLRPRLRAALPAQRQRQAWEAVDRITGGGIKMFSIKAKGRS